MKSIIATGLLLSTAILSFPSHASCSSYVVSLKKGNFRKNGGLGDAIEAAGGTLKSELRELGLVLVESDDPDFASNIGKGKSAKFLDYAIPNYQVKGGTGDPDFVAQGAFFSLEDAAVDAMDAASLSSAIPDPTGEPFFPFLWGHGAVRVTEAWDAGVFGSGVRVAVLDGGYDLTHPDLAPNVNMELSRNFVEGENLQFDPVVAESTFSHGSHVAGTIASPSNGFGMTGVAPGAELVLVKVLGDKGFGSLFDILAGIEYASSLGVDVMNLSLGAVIPQNLEGGQSDVARLRALYNKVYSYAKRQDVTVVASAGNDGLDYNDSEQAALINFMCDFSSVICISATAPFGLALDPDADVDLNELASYTSYGPMIDFAAPGGDFDLIDQGGEQLCPYNGFVLPCYVFDMVLSLTYQGWTFAAGTSMASPHAAGVAALIISERGRSMKPSQVKSEMKKRALGLGKSGRDELYGHGLVQAV